jgi:hypothetical protein
MAGAQDLCPFIEAANPNFEVSNGRFGNKIDLVDDNAVRRHDLIDGLIVVAIKHIIVEMLRDMQCVNQRYDAVEHDLAGDVVVDEKGRCHGRRIGKTARLHQDMIEVTASQQLLQNAHKIRTHIGYAADAAVGHLKNFFFGSQNKVGIYVDLPKLVLDHRNAETMLLS